MMGILMPTLVEQRLYHSISNLIDPESYICHLLNQRLGAEESIELDIIKPYLPRASAKPMEILLQS
jgi:hypothetical protein